MSRRRPKRAKELDVSGKASIVAAATGCHEELMRHCRGLNAHSAHYWALSDLSDAICRMIKQVTGQDPSWMRGATAGQQKGMGWRGAAAAPGLDEETQG